MLFGGHFIVALLSRGRAYNWLTWISKLNNNHRSALNIFYTRPEWLEDHRE